MALSDDYAKWIVEHEKEQGSEDFKAVVEAYQAALSEEQTSTAAPQTEIPPEESFLTGDNTPVGAVVQGAKNLYGGALGGAAQLGSTLMLPFDRMGVTSYTPEQRQASIQSGIQDLTGANTESLSYEVPKLMTEVAGTAGVGSALGKGVVAVAPKAAGYLAPALESGGISLGADAAGLGLLEKTAIRAGAGAVTGAATTGMINPSEITTGAVVGLTIGGVAAPVLKVVGGKLVDFATGNIYLVKARNIMLDTLGKGKGALDSARRILASSPEELTTAQALQGNSLHALSTLDKIAADVNPDVLGPQGSKTLAQFNYNMGRLGEVSGSVSEEGSRSILKEAKDLLNFVMNPRRVSALDAANVGNTVLPELEGKLSQKATAYVAALQDAGKLHTMAVQQIAKGDATAARNLGWAGNIKTQRNYDVAAGAQEGAVDAASVAKLRKAEGDLIASQIGSLKDNGIKPIVASDLIGSIARKFQTVGLSEQSRKSLTKVIKMLEAKGAMNNGKLNPYDLHAIRKEDIANIIAKESRKSNNVGVGELTKHLADAKSIIDDAIEEAGGVGWKSYLEQYAKGSQELRKWEMGALTQQMLKKKPQALVDLVNGNNTEAVESVFGKGNTSFLEMMGDDAVPITEVARNIERDMAIAAQGQSAASQMMNTILPKHTQSRLLPPFISPAVTVVNAGLREGEKRINARVMSAVATAMENPKNALNVLNTLSGAEKAEAIKAIAARTAIEQASGNYAKGYQ